MGNKKMVCPCMKICRDDIEEAIDNGASNFKDVKKKTKIVTKCGKCKAKAKCLVREIFAEKDLLIEGEEGVCLGCQGDFFEPEDDSTAKMTGEREELCSKVKKQKKSDGKKKKLKEKSSDCKKEKKSKEKVCNCKEQKKPKEKKSDAKKKKLKEKKSADKEHKYSEKKKYGEKKQKKRDEKESL